MQGGGPQGQTQHCPHERRGRRVGSPQRQSGPGRGCDRTGSVLLSGGPPCPAVAWWVGGTRTRDRTAQESGGRWSGGEKELTALSAQAS